MRTREIDIWCEYDLRASGKGTFRCTDSEESDLAGPNIYKAKLIVELPEPKKEFSKGDILEALVSVQAGGMWNNKKFLDELFGDDYEE